MSGLHSEPLFVWTGERTLELLRVIGARPAYHDVLFPRHECAPRIGQRIPKVQIQIELCAVICHGSEWYAWQLENKTMWKEGDRWRAIQKFSDTNPIKNKLKG